MAIVTPSASPPWARTADMTQLGGHVEKQNRLGVSTHNPKTDISAEQFSSLVDYVSRLSWVCPFAVTQLTCDDTGSNNPTINTYLGMNGVGSANAPVATRLSDGVFRLTWLASYSDSYGQTEAVSIRGCIITSNDTNEMVTSAIIYTNSIIVSLKDENGAAYTDGTVTVVVW